MALCIRQEFPLGRFHATPWRQSVFEDRRGEWPPSAWRLLRALAARWFQYSREVGELDSGVVESLLRALASAPPLFHLSSLGERGPALRQYQPTGEFAWSDPKKGAGALKKSKTTLVPDQYQVAGTAPVFWIWEAVVLEAPQMQLLAELLQRTLYFGRAESHSRLWIVQEAPDPNCQPCEASGGDQRAPVLVADWKAPLRIDSLLADSDSNLLRDAPVPPGAVWLHYRIALPKPAQSTAPPIMRSAGGRVVQFALGGQVYPPAERWIKVTERFRGAVLNEYEKAPGRLGPHFALLAGKDPKTGKPNSAHEHAYFVLWPDDNGDPTRLIVWRRTEPFDQEEMKSLAIASERPLIWEHMRRGPESKQSRSPWEVRFVQLPLSTPLPRDFESTSAVWESVTPFVPPVCRHRFRRNGKPRASELPEAICARLVEEAVGHRPEVEHLADGPVWTKLHEPKDAREARRREGETMALTRPGYLLRLRFEQPVTGPLIVGDSAHFGLGAFRAV
jgi:CRISPR-associated protein Csb2